MAETNNNNNSDETVSTENVFQFLWRITKLTVIQFDQDRCLQEAHALSYRTLLSVVPILSVLLAVFATIDAFAQYRDQIIDSFFQFFIPAGNTSGVRDYFGFVSKNASALQYSAVVIFILLSAYLMESIERAFNRIWGASPRPLLLKTLVFIALIVLWPLLLGRSFWATAEIQKYTGGVLELSPHAWLVLYVVPIMLMWAALTLLYMALPNTKVHLGPAATGAGIASILWEGAKVGFTYYLQYVASYDVVYGSLWVLPVLLVGMVLMWNVILFGAEIGFTLQNYRHHATGGPGDWSRSPLHLGMAVMLDVSRQFMIGGRMPTLETLSRRFIVGIPYLRKIIDDLIASKILLHAGDDRDGFVPARRPENITFGDVLNALEDGQSLGWKFKHGSIRQSFKFGHGDSGDTTIQENAVADSIRYAG